MLNVYELIVLLVLGVFGLIPNYVFGDDDPDVDHPIVLELGPAFERDIKAKSTDYGGSGAIETTPIEHWLEIEYGFTLLNTGGRTAIEADILFKKPFQLSQMAELMVGLGPTFARKISGDERSTSHGIEFVLDFMFWPTKSVGWYLEPSYGIGLGGAHGERTIGGSAGILYRWR